MAVTRRPPQRRRPPLVDFYHERRDERRTSSPRSKSTRRTGPPPPRRGKKTRLPTRKGVPFSATLVIALFFGFVVVYMALRAYGFFTPSINIMTLRLGNIEVQQSAPGMIVRYEQVFRADKDGRVVFMVSEFDQVRDGVAVASVRDIEAVNQNDQALALLQQEIIGVHEMRHATQSDPMVERVNVNLRNRMDRSMHHHMQMNLFEVYALLERLSQITYNRNRMIIDESLNVRSDLSRQYDRLNAQRGMNLNDIYATHTGIMSPTIDGFEDRFTPANMRDMTREEVRMNVDLEAIIPGREVKAGDEIFKIVGNTWYVASWMPNEMVQGFNIGAERVVFIENTATGRFEPVTMRIHAINYGHLDTFVVFRSTRYVINFLDRRNVNIRLVDNIQSGFMIPLSAIATRRFFRVPLTHIHGVEDYFIMHRTDYGLQPVPVHVYERTETCAYILEDTISLLQGDAIAPVDPNEKHHIIFETDVRIVRGVYRTTLNYADFRVINIEGGTVNGVDHILLDPARNPLIRQFDTIVTDAAMVRQGQVVR